MQVACFRDRLLSGERLLGTFVKTPTIHAIEILAYAGLDFVVLDAEHSAIGRRDLDCMLLAARSVNLDALVRVQGIQPSSVLTPLDCGASGILTPLYFDAGTGHSSGAWDSISKWCTRLLWRDQGCRLCGSTMANAIADSDARVAVVAQIEDEEALSTLDQILETPGLDAIFIGRGDLAVSRGSTQATIQPCETRRKTSCRERDLVQSQLQPLQV